MEKYLTTAEGRRLLTSRDLHNPWRKWGPYIAERAWGTVREDYSADGDAWEFLTHDMARSKAYRWGEDAIAGWCDNRQHLCFGLALWNTKDAILKERLFGLSAPEGNHGEDVKELFYYLDATPTHSYMKFLYQYPQAAFPYDALVKENAARTREQPEYELLDTGVFDEHRYFDIEIEYAKNEPEDTLILITATNRGPDSAPLHLIPQLWFRNTWSWKPLPEPEPIIELLTDAAARVELSCAHESLGRYFVTAGGKPRLLFTENVTNNVRLYGVANTRPHVKDAFNEFIVHQQADAVNPGSRGTKVGLQYQFQIAPGESVKIQLVISNQKASELLNNHDAVFAQRRAEADEFYASVHPAELGDEEQCIQRQALAGLLWSKQFYFYDVHTWLRGDNPAAPPPAERLQGRNSSWEELYVDDVMSMPDRWEYPWFAAWDLAFHTIPLAMVDIDFAKQQLELLVGAKLMHLSGQIPAYEWQFSDVNPPVQAWAVWRVYNMEKHANAEKGDLQFLERCYHKLLMDFTWWVNRKDTTGRNVFEGGFLGLDNISVFDRSKPMPGGGWLEQADGTGWMALFCLNLMAIGLELAQEDSVYEHLGAKFFEHFMHISAAINQEVPGDVNMWDDHDGWYYDVAHEKSAGTDKAEALRVRSLVGLVPLFAVQVLDESWFDKLPHFRRRYEWLLTNRPEFAGGLSCIWTPDGHKCLLSIVNHERLGRILSRVLDENEFLSNFGIRSISRCHLEHPFTLSTGSGQMNVNYEPGESTSGLYGGNSNWRGPIWFPTTFMLTTALRVYDRFYGENFKIECPTGSGRFMTLDQVAMEIACRLCSLFKRDSSGNRPIYTHTHMADDDRSDLLLFHEYFHGDTGQGLGASHQTGWTALVAKYLEQLASSKDRGPDGHKPHGPNPYAPDP